MASDGAGINRDRAVDRATKEVPRLWNTPASQFASIFFSPNVPGPGAGADKGQDFFTFVAGILDWFTGGVSTQGPSHYSTNFDCLSLPIFLESLVSPG